jgi:hypothetical protein
VGSTGGGRVKGERVAVSVSADVVERVEKRCLPVGASDLGVL